MIGRGGRGTPTARSSSTSSAIACSTSCRTERPPRWLRGLRHRRAPRSSAGSVRAPTPRARLWEPQTRSRWGRPRPPAPQSHRGRPAGTRAPYLPDRSTAGVTGTVGAPIPAKRDGPVASKLAISRRPGLSRATISRWLRAGHFIECQRPQRDGRRSPLTPSSCGSALRRAVTTRLGSGASCADERRRTGVCRGDLHGVSAGRHRPHARCWRPALRSVAGHRHRLGYVRLPKPISQSRLCESTGLPQSHNPYRANQSPSFAAALARTERALRTYRMTVFTSFCPVWSMISSTRAPAAAALVTKPARSECPA